MRRILVRGPNWIGDHVMAFPFFAGLRSYYAADHITLLSRVKANELGGCYWDDYVPLSGDKLLLRKPFDLGITLPSGTSSAWLLFRLGIPIRIGYAEAIARIFLTQSIPFPGRGSQKHKSEIYGDLLRWIGGVPETPITAQHTRGSKIVIAPGASITLREWPYYPELINEINRRFPGYPVVLVGETASRFWATRAERLGGRFENKIGKTTLAELMLLLQSARIVVCNDSGVAHLAGLVSCPGVVIFGPGDPRYIRPSFEGLLHLRDTELACSPCESSRCRAPYGYQRCLRNVSVDKVLDAISDRLSL